MNAALLALAAVGSGGLLAESRPAPARAPHAVGNTRCSVCHTTVSWTRVTFDHDRTGFPLRGRHATTQCSSCHASADFKTAVSASCAACHRDAHVGEFGTRCASCHDAESWRSRFTADAHRRTNFPLTGRHAVIACEECHLDQRDRTFTRATVECFACHQNDYARTGAISIDHAAAGFGTNCRECHNPQTFRAARFPAHDRCFQLAPGPHAGIACLDCHTRLAGTAVTGACATNTASCTRCHVCPTMQDRHRQVAGFQCKDRKCYECHQFSVAAPRVPPRKGG